MSAREQTFTPEERASGVCPPNYGWDGVRVRIANEIRAAVAAEREGCAAVVDSLAGNAPPTIAAAIRGRTA